jgi:UDP-N-acetylmuramoyl-tripeptide--D-alanyl-D-alanine ligase
MRELGEESVSEHTRILQLLADDYACRFESVLLVGAEFQKTNAPFRTFADVEEVKQELTRHQPEGMTILIKGSNSTHLYELPPLL